MCGDVCLSIQREFRKHIEEHFQIMARLNNTNALHEIIYRDQLIDTDTAYNQYKVAQGNQYKLNENQHESTKLWLNNLQNTKGFSIYVDQNFKQNYTFCFISLAKKIFKVLIFAWIQRIRQPIQIIIFCILLLLGILLIDLRLTIQKLQS